MSSTTSLDAFQQIENAESQNDETQTSVAESAT